MMGDVDLGILDECESWFLTSKFFPSKVGGKPAWLDLKDLPSTERLLCGICREPCIFLCQVYAPLDDKDGCFHRTIFVFICLNGSCCKTNGTDNIKVFRSQLPRHNEFYSPDPPEEQDEDIPFPLMPPLCVVCGCVGRSQCGGCHLARYCSRSHQTADWKAGHKVICKDIHIKRQAGIPVLPSSVISSSSQMLLLKEWLLDIEPEPFGDMPSESENQANERRMAEFKTLRERNAVGTMSEVPDVDLNPFTEAHDKAFWKFNKRVSLNPEQVLRFHRNGHPLWISSKHILSQDSVPPCVYCNGPRIFEFQIMPQLLNSINVTSMIDSIDWGTICVYSCKESCDSGPAYKTEFVYKQDITEDKSLNNK